MIERTQEDVERFRADMRRIDGRSFSTEAGQFAAQSIPSSRRAQALNRLNRMRDAIAEHIGEANKDENVVWLDVLTRIQAALIASDKQEWGCYPDKDGNVTITLKLADKAVLQSGKL